MQQHFMKINLTRLRYLRSYNHYASMPLVDNLAACKININNEFIFRDKFLCDIKLETDDGGVVCGHKVVLLSASNYFRAMFTSFGERYEDAVKIRYLDSYILQLLVDYIYTGKIMVSKKNVQVYTFFHIYCGFL